MTDTIKIVHLISDMSLGGVTKNLEIFDQGPLAKDYVSQIVQVQPKWNIAANFDADIIITHFSPSWANLPFLYALRKRNGRSKILHMEHSYSPEWEAYTVSKQKRFRTMLKMTYALFDKIICVSKTQSLWMANIGVAPLSKHKIINPWSDIDILSKVQAPTFSRDKPLVIGSYGRLVKEKGFEDLIESFLKMPANDDVRLLIGGYGPDEEYLKSLAAMNPKIQFYGLVANVAAFMQHCDIVAVPSYFETYGLVATEARAAARPILVSLVGSLAEQINEAGQVINFKDHETAGQTLSSLRLLPLQSMSQAGRHSCDNLTRIQTLNWLHFLDQTLHGNG